MAPPVNEHDAGTARDEARTTSATGAPTPSGSSAKPAHFTVSSRVLFTLFWWLVLLFHFFNAAFVFLMGGVHVFISQPVVYESGALLRIPIQVLSLAGWTFIAIALVHTCAAMRMVYFSLRRCYLSFGNEPVGHGRVAAAESASKARAKQTSNSIPEGRRLTHWISGIYEALGRVFGSNGIFGFHSQHFDAVLYARQGAEIILQTYQVDQISHSVARRWLNDVVVLLVVLNCVYLPLTELAIPGNLRRRRFVLVTIDLLLEFSICIGVPVAVILPYALVFNWRLFQFPDHLGYDDTWFISLLSELRQVLVSSLTDYVSSVFPHIATLVSLSTIKALLYRKTRASNNSSASSRRSSATQSFPLRTSAASPIPTTPARLIRRRVRKWLFHGFTLLWAAIVVVMQARARHRGKAASAFEPCALSVNPWSATNLTCTVVHLNCHRLAEGSTVTTILAQVERTVLTKLTFSHCATLSMPTILHEFPNLLALETFNTSIIDWPLAAAMNKRLHQHAIQVQLIDTNLTTFPLGLLHDELPPNLNLLIYRSNLTTLPDGCGDVWAGHLWRYFKIEHTKLKSLPASMVRMQIRKLSLVDNLLTHIDDELFVNQSFTGVRLSQNPLHALPRQFGSKSQLRQFVAQDTNISEVPEWLREWWALRAASGLKTIVSLAGSPVCDTTDGRESWACALVDPAYSGDFRYDLIVPLRPL